MNHSVFIAAAALMCGSAFAQTSSTTPSSGGGEMKTDSSKKAEMSTAGTSTTTMGAGGSSSGMGMMKGMDANGDGMVSKKEWDDHHSMMWNKMSKNGMVSMNDMERMMRGGPN